MGKSINHEFKQKIHYSYLTTPEVVKPILELVTLGTRTIQAAPLFSKKPNSDIFYTDGNVGIGTDDPSAKLDVDGVITCRGITSIGASSFVTTAENNDVTVKQGTSLNDTSISIISGSYSSKAIMYLGTPYWPPPPEERSEVKKAAIIAEGVSSFSKSKLHFCLNNDDSNNKDYTARLNRDEVMTLTHSRNVGIGTTNPTTNLDVCGNTLLRNDLTVNGSTIFNGNVGIGANNPQALLDVSGTGAIILPRGTSDERPANISGSLRYNTESNEFEGYNGMGNYWRR